jgi:hypothetical protein
MPGGDQQSHRQEKGSRNRTSWFSWERSRTGGISLIYGSASSGPFGTGHAHAGVLVILSLVMSMDWRHQIRPVSLRDWAHPVRRSCCRLDSFDRQSLPTRESRMD